MTFLPIVERELRVAARHRFTYWLRPVAAAVPLVIFSAVLVLIFLDPPPGNRAGRIEFAILSWMAFVYASGSGVILTSDTLSEEKREGTLGLLFLTDLRGYDLVLGKLISHSLRGFYSLVAAFPVLALPLLMGGVTARLFGISLLVICNTLFLSLTIGMFVSSISREVTKAMTLTLALTLFFVGGLPWLDLALAHWDPSKFDCVLSVGSPGHLFAVEEYTKPRDFWRRLVLQHALAWTFLVLACICVPRAWTEKSKNAGGWPDRFLAMWSFGGKKQRLRFRRKMLGRNPIQWLAGRNRAMLKLVLTLVICSTAALVWSLSLHRKTNPSGEAGFFMLPFIPFLVLWISLRAADLLATARRNGTLELILVTGVPPQQIVQGHWSNLWKTFLVPVLFLSGLMVAADTESLWNIMANRTAYGDQYREVFESEIIDMGIQVTYAVANAVALAWCGMWMGLTSRNTSLAVLKTVCLVCVLPFLAEMFIEIISESFLPRLRRGFLGASWPAWLSDVFIASLDLGKVVLLIFWSRWRLLTTMRERAVMGDQPRARPKNPQAISGIPAAASGNQFP
jgi:ABC-type transport system involved in cytochrome c biogenesis permease component